MLLKVLGAVSREFRGLDSRQKHAGMTDYEHHEIPTLESFLVATSG